MSKKSRAVPRTTPPIPKLEGTDEGGCVITFGHNVHDRRVCMLFNVQAQQLIFTPEEAEDVAANLQRYARLARGGDTPLLTPWHGRAKPKPS